jgi:hypothetical protein
MLTDHFVQQRFGMSRYQNREDMVKTVKQVVSDIMIMSTINIDFNRTKQLAHVLYQLSDLVYFEDAFANEANPEQLIVSMMEAMRKLLSSNQ